MPQNKTGDNGELHDSNIDEGITDSSATNEASMKEDLQALVDSEANLSEGFKNKAETIFEAALNEKVSKKVEELEESYNQKLDEESESIENNMIEKVDNYLDYVVENWMEDNKLAIENGLRTEIAESFITALKGVFNEHYVEVPDGKADMVDELASKAEKLENELNESVDRSMKLREELKELKREKIVSEAAEGLTMTQAEKLKSLAEGIEFEDENLFEKKIDTLKDSYFTETNSARKSRTRNLTETTELDADVPEEQDTLSPRMARYVRAVSGDNK